MIAQGGGSSSYVVDGGVLSNFPMWLFMDGKVKKWKRPVIGFQLTPELHEIPAHSIYNAVSMYRALFETMSSAHDLRYISEGPCEKYCLYPCLRCESNRLSIIGSTKRTINGVRKGRNCTIFSNMDTLKRRIER